MRVWLSKDVQKAHELNIKLLGVMLCIQWRSWQPTWSGYDPWMFSISFRFGLHYKSFYIVRPKDIGYDQDNILGIR